MTPSPVVTSMAPPGGLHLTALSSRFLTARRSRSAICATVVGSMRLEHHAGSAVARPLHRLVHEQIQPDGLLRELLLLAAGQLDEVGDEDRQLLDLVDRLAENLVALVVGEVVLAAQELEVGAEARDRRSCSSGGVRHELSLRALRCFERLEHRVEILRQFLGEPRPCPRRRHAH